jgi:hypothetical protein
MLFLYLLFVTPVALAAITFDRFASERLESDVRAADLSLARAVALKTDAELSRAIQTVEELATFPAVRTGHAGRSSRGTRRELRGPEGIFGRLTSG